MLQCHDEGAQNLARSAMAGVYPFRQNPLDALQVPQAHAHIGPRASESTPAKDRRTLSVECFNSFAEVLRTSQAAVAMPLKLNGDSQWRIFCVVEQLLGRTLRERRKSDEFLHQIRGGSLKLGFGNALSRDAPFNSLGA